MKKMTRHDYDLLARVYSYPGVRSSTAGPDQIEKLIANGCLIEHAGRLSITAFGRVQLDRVRGTGLGSFKVPTGYALVPRKITQEMVDAAAKSGARLTQSGYTQILFAAPKVKL